MSEPIPDYRCIECRGIACPIESKKGGKDQESVQSSTTPEPGYHMGK